MAAFSIQSDSSQKVIAVGQDISKETTLDVFRGIAAVSGLSVTMDVEKLAKDFLVRILLEDTEGHKYLVAESYKEIVSEESSLQHFTNYCEETALLGGVIPSKLLVYVSNAKVSLHSLQVSVTNSAMKAKARAVLQGQMETLKRQQTQAKVDQINAYNEANNKLWRAGVTGLSLKPYEEKMVMLGFPSAISTGGLEYYAGGIFEFGESQTSSSLYVEPIESSYNSLAEFDWRNRHGKNWVTSVKDQGWTQSCTAYAAVGALESVLQLYYNQLFPNLDLSEGDVMEGLLPDINIIVEGAENTSDVVEYVVNNGVHDQANNNYIGGTKYQSNPNPLQFVRPAGYGQCVLNNDTIKRYLREKGPMISGFQVSFWNSYAQKTQRNGHAMEMIGYGKVHPGMVLRYYISNYETAYDTIRTGNGKIGQDYYIFKNSYGEDGSVSPPYMYIAFNNHLNYMIGPYYYTTPIQCKEYDSEDYYLKKEYSEVDIACEDNDGDYFYFWGIGPRPSSCSEYAMEEIDGDDSNPFLGPINSNGHIMSLNPNSTELLDARDALFNSSGYGVLHCYSHCEVVASPNPCVTYGHIYFHNGAKIFVRSGATLIVDDFILYNADIVMEPGSHLILRDGSRVVLRQGRSFSPPIGATVEIEEGSIEPYSVITQFPWPF
ncbi:MAG: hypothetical protein IJV36_04860 [Prevotella sp.]|nr:hypothetical protein [Prevotella sp.]